MLLYLISVGFESDGTQRRKIGWLFTLYCCSLTILLGIRPLLSEYFFNYQRNHNWLQFKEHWLDSVFVEPLYTFNLLFCSNITRMCTYKSILQANQTIRTNSAGGNKKQASDARIIVYKPEIFRLKATILDRKL